MPIQNKHFPKTLFLLELDTQCKLVEKCSSQLELASLYWIQLEQGIDDGLSISPIEIIASCVTCLSAMAAIKRLLFSTKNNASKRRCTLVMDILGHPDLPSLRSLDVRNAWEHFDERLDELCCTELPNSISPIYVSAKVPANDTLALRRFDPIDLTISYIDKSILLRPCLVEIQRLKTCIRDAFSILQNSDNLNHSIMKGA